MAKYKSVLLLSSGLDSAANLVLCEAIDAEVKLAITFNYGQKSFLQEIEHAKKLCQYFKIEHKIIDVPLFSEWVGKNSALLNDQDSIPSPTDLDEMSVITKTAKAVWVPNRNGVFLSLAAAIAESMNLDSVLVGFNAEEAVTFPDNSLEYIIAFNEGLKFSTANQICIRSATVGFNKKEIVRKIAEVDFPFELIWSCYRDGEKHCGECESCQRLRRALIESLPEAKSNEILKGLMA